jgi:hypothetical protein
MCAGTFIEKDYCSHYKYIIRHRCLTTMLQLTVLSLYVCYYLLCLRSHILDTVTKDYVGGRSFQTPYKRWQVRL